MDALETVKNFMLEKLKEVLVVLENFGKYLEEKWNTVISPEIRDSKIYPWLINVCLPVTVGILFLLLLFWCCKRCCCCCCGRRGLNYKMMKAPGRGFRMRRSDFESNPRSYFRDLRGKKPKNSSAHDDDNMYLRSDLYLDP